MSDEIFFNASRDILLVLPHRADDVARLGVLLEHDCPVVTVIGKYNHGKSRLLNELLGQNVFAVADRRETAQLAEVRHNGVQWLDAPGLDADVINVDDTHARRAAWLLSDVRLFVHAAKEGELDAQELGTLAELIDDTSRSRRQTILVLTQIDQLSGDDDLQKVKHDIERQAGALALHAVSASRYRKGRDEGKRLLVEKSGMPMLIAGVAAAVDAVPAARAHEIGILLTGLSDEIAILRGEHEQTLERNRTRQREQRQSFELGLNNVIEKASRDIESMLDRLGEDHAAIPDTAKDAYALTIGKVERARIQTAYSRACIEIDAFLAGWGVVTIPIEQATVARALNSVIVAVMGVSVKRREHLRRMFSSPAGRQRLRDGFTHYYERSTDRKLLAQRIADTEAALATLARAANAVRACSRQPA